MSLSETTPTESLWRNSAFTRLWLAQAISTAGTHVTAVALPLIAILSLGATPFQMGLLTIADRLPKFLFSLFIGVWVDRNRRRRLLISANLLRALFIGSLPIAALFGALTYLQLWIVAFGVGALSILFTTASAAIVPTLVPRSQLVEANSKLAISDSVLSIAGPGIAGTLVQLLGASKAIIADVIAYLCSALALRGIRDVRPTTEKLPSRSLRAEIGEGIHELIRTPVLRALTLSAGVGTFGSALQSTALFLFFIHNLEMTPVLIGFVYVCGGLGALTGAFLAGRAAQRIGVGTTIVLGNLLWAMAALVIPLSSFAPMSVVVVLLSETAASLGGAIWGVNQISLRQTLTPTRLFGRTTAARQCFMFSMQLIGALIGGIVGDIIGLQATLLIGAVGLVGGWLLIWRSPVRAVHTLEA